MESNLWNGTDLEVLRSDHDMELDGSFIPEHLVRPSPHRADELHCPNAIVGHQNLLNDLLAPITANKLFRGGHL